ncbi:acetyltransferase [Paenibacillus nasutitermitis]|uniref:N-acetyltransferase n=1 Tax=Paenibacillus nasutitermitis TaxID=1652958 RepID=A0A916ZB19_9BACL|nr:acetyltransferase [Paenibacillus nasutitermitis]GGD85288.1 N-acetyltransferase [Paenibacillus nasutitermitis]
MSMEVQQSIARRVESAETSTLFSRLNAIKNLEGNPEQVYIKPFGNATAFIVKGIPDPYFNSVRGLTSEDIDLLDDMIAFYRDHNMPCRFDIAPLVNADLMLKLAERGYYQYGFHSSLYGLPKKELPVPRNMDDGLSIRKLHESEFSLFGEIYTKAFKMPEFLAPSVTRNNYILKDIPGWHFYLASYQNLPAAIAVLNVQDGVGSLAAAATLPMFQGKGCHAALLAARIKESEELHCDFVIGQARFGSISQGNMERLGLRIAYTKSLWKEMPGD